MSTTQHMHVQVRDGHPRGFANVERDPESSFEHAFEAGHFASESKHAGQRFGMAPLNFARVSDVLLGDNEDMHRRSGIDVPNRERFGVLGDPRHGYFAGVHLAEKAVGGHTRYCTLMPDELSPADDQRLPGPDVLSLFWSPVCAVGSHGAHGANAQLCVSVFGAGIVPEQPRVMVVLYNTNFTRDLVKHNGTLVVTVLAEGQEYLLGPLGTTSGRESQKLDPTQYAVTAVGDPYFPGGYGMLECDVIEEVDLGDATAFVCAVRSKRRLYGSKPLARHIALAAQPPEVLERWATVQAAAQEASRASQHWRD